MREIRFRAWNKKSKSMGDWDFLKDMPVHLSWMHWAFNGNENIILMQFTGLHDRNGTPIWEGDICKCMITNGLEYSVAVGAIEWGEVSWMIDFPNHGVTLNLCQFECPSENLEVIGNEYENPELLE